MDADGARLERVRYPRPEAGGEVEAWRLSPRELRARVVAAHGAGNDALYPQLALFEALVRREMGGAYPLSVPLEVSVGSGQDWNGADH